jgi:hypothetical protein
MPTNIKVALCARGYADHQGHKSVQKQLRVCRVAAAKADWILLVNVSECKKGTTTSLDEGGRRPTSRNQ